MKNTPIIPAESAEQQALFQWARLSEGRYPELRLLHHIPNGGLRNKPVAVRLTAEGVRRGVPDVCLPVARGKYHGLYIELKRLRGGTVSPEQAEWIEALERQGYMARVCRGFDEARETIEGYLAIGTCPTCAHHLGAEQCRINAEGECREGGGYELWKGKDEQADS